MTAEHDRLREICDDAHGWRRWGPYVSDRSWATVREDYSADGDAWNYLPHDLARSKAYRWGEDGIAGICDRYQLLVFSPAFWNRRDPILKERLFGLTPYEGNHGEDVKEYYFHLDNTPTHSYMRFLYKYPQAAFPYEQLIAENVRRQGQGEEFELLDTGAFEGDRYFDIVIEYAKADPEDICIRIEAINRGPQPAAIDLVPHLWFRNLWSWSGAADPQPSIRRGRCTSDYISLVADDSRLATPRTMPRDYHLGPRILYAPPGGKPLFTDNETNGPRVFGPGCASRSAFVKDAFHRAIVQGEECVNPAGTGTKAAIHYRFDAVPPGGAACLRLRLADERALDDPLAIDGIVQARRAEADDFYESLYAKGASDDERRIQRQAWAGLLWTKQSYLFDVADWLDGDNPAVPPPASRPSIRNRHWRHLNSMRVMTVPDKWEYPWFAAWDLAFQCVALAPIDPQYAMDQLSVLLFEQFQHANGQLPAYEWEFSDLNPPVHAWAVWRVYNMARIRTGRADRAFLERCFHKLLTNFTWWVNRVDRKGNNVFEGGFLGLDNITVVDRSVALGGGAVLDQSDTTGWMGMFCLNLMRIALELAKENPVYEGLAVKFFEHYTYIAAAMKHMRDGGIPLWNDEDGFFYDVLRYSDGRAEPFRVRSLVGLIPLFAVERLEMSWIEPFREFTASLRWFLENRRELVKDVVHLHERDGRLTYVLTIVNNDQLARLLGYVFDPNEFLSDFGVRSLSRAHRSSPFRFQDRTVEYEPAEAVSKLKGGNSNWRGPIWLPPNFLLIESLRKLGTAYGPDIRVPCAGHAGPGLTFLEMAREIAERLMALFTRDACGRRPLHGNADKFQTDPHWKDLPLFYEYFHGENGAGLGASHQTGWTALAASLIDEWRSDATATRPRSL